MATATAAACSAARSRFANAMPRKKHKLLLFLPCAVVVFGFGARLAPFGQDPSPNQSKSLAMNASAVAKTVSQGSRLPPFTFLVPSSADRNDYPGALVKLR